MRVIVCGSRFALNRDEVHAALDAFHAETPIVQVIHGGAAGVDRFAGQWATARRIAQHIMEAEWSEQGRAAGPVRNRRMLLLKPDMVLAFPGGPGTANMVKQATGANVPVKHLLEAPSDTRDH